MAEVGRSGTKVQSSTSLCGKGWQHSTTSLRQRGRARNDMLIGTVLYNGWLFLSGGPAIPVGMVLLWAMVTIPPLLEDSGISLFYNLVSCGILKGWFA